MKKFGLFCTLFMSSWLGFGQVDSIKFRNELGINFSPIISALSGREAPETTFELRYHRNLKKSWYLRTIVGVGLPKMNAFYPNDENQRITQLTDSTVLVENQIPFDQMARLSLGVEYRIRQQKKFQIALKLKGAVNQILLLMYRSFAPSVTFYDA